jgi:hypothetical protein
VLDPELAGGCVDLAIRTDQTNGNDYIFASCGLGFSDHGTIYRNTSAQAGGSWSVSYTESTMGRTSLALAPSNQNVIYALAAVKGSHGMLAVLRSTDGGGTWASRVRNTNPTKLNTMLLTNPIISFNQECFGGTNQFFNQGWYDNVIAVDPVDSNRVWAGGIDLFRSDGGGANWGMALHWWAPRGTSHFVHADQHVIAFHPQYNASSNKVMYVTNDGGIFRTDDARTATVSSPCNNGIGLNWVSLNNGYGVTQFYYGLPYPGGGLYFGGAQDNGTPRGRSVHTAIHYGPHQFTAPVDGRGLHVADLQWRG